MTGQGSYHGNKDTGRFCVPGCTRTGRGAAEVADFDSARRALMEGYLPCVECQPMAAGLEPPGNVTELLREVSEDTFAALSDGAMRDRGVEADRLRRWFQRAHGMTFQDYLRLQRVNSLFGTVSYLAGEPGTKSEPAGIVVTRLDTPLGPMLAGASGSGICLLEFTDRRMLETQLRRLEKYLGPDLGVGTSTYFDALSVQLQEYFAGSRRSFSVPLDAPGTAFQIRAWDALMTIPYGETRSYQDQAVAIGRPTAVRAVARANGDNRIAIVIPCHRVIGKDGSLTGYGGKLWRKKRLLELEGVSIGRVQGRLF